MYFDKSNKSWFMQPNLQRNRADLLNFASNMILTDSGWQKPETEVFEDHVASIALKPWSHLNLLHAYRVVTIKAFRPQQKHLLEKMEEITLDFLHLCKSCTDPPVFFCSLFALAQHEDGVHKQDPLHVKLPEVKPKFACQSCRLIFNHKQQCIRHVRLFHYEDTISHGKGNAVSGNNWKQKAQTRNIWAVAATHLVVDCDPVHTTMAEEIKGDSHEYISEAQSCSLCGNRKFILGELVHSDGEKTKICSNCRVRRYGTHFPCEHCYLMFIKQGDLKLHMEQVKEGWHPRVQVQIEESVFCEVNETTAYAKMK